MTECPFLTKHALARDGSAFVRCKLEDVLSGCIYHPDSYHKCPALNFIKAMNCPKCGQPILEEAA